MSLKMGGIDLNKFLRHFLWLVVKIVFTPPCHLATSEKFSSITQSNDMCGFIFTASDNAGSAWMRSPIEVNLIRSIFFMK